MKYILLATLLVGCAWLFLYGVKIKSGPIKVYINGLAVRYDLEDKPTN